MATNYLIETMDRAGNWDAFGLGGPDAQTCESHSEALHLIDHCVSSGVLAEDAHARIVTIEGGHRTTVDQVR